MRVSIIVAVAENGVIGRAGKLPWHLADDLRRFKQLTTGHTVIMGRKTWESIARRLPGRRMVVVSRQPNHRTGEKDVIVAGSLGDAIRFAESAGDDEAFVIGGAEVYREALPKADRLYLTRIHAHVDGDTHLPSVDWNAWRVVESHRHESDAANEFPFTFELYERIARD